MPARANAPVEYDQNAAGRTIAAAFDPDFYRTTYADLPADVSPLWHYRVQGWREGRDPAPWFSGEAYLADNPDLAAVGVEPFLHFLTHGAREGRAVRPSRHGPAFLGQRDWGGTWRFEAFGATASVAAAAPATAPRAPVMPLDDQALAVGPAFDAAFYLAVNPDIAASGMDPLQHFLMTGWLEGRDPTARFSVRDYLELHPDVAASGLNPFVHYVLAGQAEGRAAKNDLGFRYDLVVRVTSVEERIAKAAEAAARVRTDPPAKLAAGLGRLRDLHVTVSHDDYVAHFGGLQLCLRRESDALTARGATHLHLFPAAAWPTVRRPDEPGPLGVLLNGRRLGTYEPADVRAALAAAVTKGGRRSFAIHSLLGHCPDETADILEAAGLRQGFFWLHDFASLCAGFHLLRNDVVDCAAPPAGSGACAVCAYGPQRARHTEAHRRLFERLAITVAAPSQTTLDFWSEHTDLPAKARKVVPHATLKPRGRAAKTPDGRPLRVAFLGMPAALKGWPVFRELAQAHAGDPRYEFLHLGGRSDPAAPAGFHPVVVTAERPLAMQEAVEALEADVALIWPLCRETFSFTAYEAAAGGAAVLTGPDSGNVAAFASDPKVGRVLPDEAALMAAFASGEILGLSRNARKARLFDLAYSGMSGELIGEARR
ncbi:MAG: hypothetical protein AB1942_24630 [Pseudomonadota bacterium]